MWEPIENLPEEKGEIYKKNSGGKGW